MDFVAVSIWDKCKGFYISEKEIKTDIKNLEENKKIYEPVMIHSTLNIKGCIQSRRLGSEAQTLHFPFGSFYCHLPAILYSTGSGSKVL